METKTRRELLTLCKERGLKGYITKKTEELVALLEPGQFFTEPYDTIKAHIDGVLNKDNDLFASSNDEPTPMGCVEEMLSKVPAEFWTRKGLRVLDPCCGTGNFHAVAGHLLRQAGYSPVELQEALHFNDINEKRLAHVIKLFGDKNLTRNDFLAVPWQAMYDLVVMNPPYARLMADGSRASKNHGLAVSFLKKGLAALKPGGFLVAIVPDSWMSLADRNDFCDELTQYQFHALNIHGAKPWFPKVGSSFTWFVVEKVPGVNPFEVSYLERGVNHTSMVKSQRRPYIPLKYSSTIQSIFAKTVDAANEKYAVETSSNLHRYTQRDLIRDEQDETYCHRLIHTPKQTAWASRPHKFQEGWKVFLSTTDKYRAFADSCGMTQSIAFIRVASEEEARATAARLSHPLYVFLNNACRYGNFNNIRVLQRFPVCHTGDPYKEFGLTPEEIAVM